MKETIKSKYVPVNQLLVDGENISQIIRYFTPILICFSLINKRLCLNLFRSKRLLYGDMLRQDSLAWRVLGYPVQELEPVLAQFQESIKVMVWSHLCSVHDFGMAFSDDYQASGTSWEKVGSISLDLFFPLFNKKISYSH